MLQRSTAVSGVVLGSLLAVVLTAGAAPAAAQVTYTVDRAAGPGRITGTIATNGRLGALSAGDIVAWSLSIDADADGTSTQFVGPAGPPPMPGMPPPGLALFGDSLTATETGLFFNFVMPVPPAPPAFGMLQLSSPDTSWVWQLQSGIMSDELIREAHGNQQMVGRSGLEQIASTVVAPLEITADTTLTADRRGPIVIAADDVTLDCGDHSVTASARGIGIHAAGRSGITIKRCVVWNFGEGIVLEDSSDSVLSENTLSENAAAGIRLTGAHRNRVTGNLVTYTRGPSGQAKGLVLESSSENVVDFNTVDHTDLAGILVGDGSRKNDLVGNVSSFNRGAGFDVSSASSNVLRRNTATRNRDSGFVVRGAASRNKLFDNSACLNQPNDATQIVDGPGSQGNAWALNLFCSPAF